jgi:LEA14-like dessication related protein
MSSDGVRRLFLGSKLRIAVTAVVALVALVVVAFLLGLVGVPAVEGVENRFGSVDDSTTTIHTDLTVNNPNPIGVSLGGTTVNYSVLMNDVRMATGVKDGVAVERGTSTLSFTTRMRNDRIPPWWVSHIRANETTDVLIDARVSSSLLGGRTFEVPQERTIETDLIGNFNSEETRPIEANRPVIEDPVLYVNETSASWDREALSAEETPIDMGFTVHNPKPYPYAVSEIAYEIRMNGIVVGEGSSEDLATVPPGATETIDTRTAIVNSNLDEWWVSHLQRNQVTDLEIDFSVVVDPVEEDGPVGGLDRTVGEIELPVEPLDYEERIETDIFGTKNETAGSDGAGSDDGSTGGDGDAGDGTADDGATTETPTPTETPTDDGGLLGGGDDSTATPESDDTPTPAPTEVPTDGPLGPDRPTRTDDGGLIG